MNKKLEKTSTVVYINNLSKRKTKSAIPYLSVSKAVTGVLFDMLLPAFAV